MSQDWIDDCFKFWGKTLTGNKAHWCPEFDDLPIDETCDEYDIFCTCDLSNNETP